MDDRTLFFNGIHAATGRYLLPEMSLTRFVETVVGRRWRPAPPRRRPKSRIDPDDLAAAGWAVVFPGGADPAIREGLDELLKHRRADASARDERLFRELAYSSGESKLDFLARHGAGPGPVDPRNVPYYLLLVGGPEAIPFDIQYQLGVQYAVGRLDLDGPADYAAYAGSVVAAERGEVRRDRRAVFFGVGNEDDPLTRSSVDHFVKPLSKAFADDPVDWEVETVLGAGASKTKLDSFLGGGRTPAFLFTAGHGIGFDHGDDLQRTRQGALVCSDWPGPMVWDGGAVPPDHYFAAEDVGGDADVAGLVSFHFGCFTAGTPRIDSFERGKTPEEIAPHGFVARLPRRLLAHPRGGALAVVGHVDRAWESSYFWDDAGSQTAVFESMAHDLLSGRRLGPAMEVFGQRSAELALDLDGTEASRDEVLARIWAAQRDARGYVVLGDPAIRVAAAL